MANAPRERGKANAGRVAAVRAMLAIEEGQNAEAALANLVPQDAADRALAWNLVFGALRNRPALDVAIATATNRAVWTLDPPVLAVLRIGLYERTFTRTPPHASVDQAVEVARVVQVGHASGLVNAVMRRAEVPQEGAVALGFPSWIVDRWAARYGKPAVGAYARSANEPAVIYIVAKEDPAGLAASFQKAGMPLLPVGAGVFQLPPRVGRIDDLPGFPEGQFWVMDRAAAAVADLAGEVPHDATALDCCAAPGGKSFRLAAAGWNVTSTDVDADRIVRIRQGAERLGLPLTIATHDWLVGPMPGKYDLVLVDAPCTALGLLRRHPEIRWRRKFEDIAGVAAKQVTILQHAAACVRPGGVLVYAVCSPEPEEGMRVAATLGWLVEATFDNALDPDGGDLFYAVRMRAPG